eukprot:s125_g14.t2
MTGESCSSLSQKVLHECRTRRSFRDLQQERRREREKKTVPSQAAMQEGDEIFEAAMVAVKRHFDAEEFEPALKLITKAYDMKPHDPLVVRTAQKRIDPQVAKAVRKMLSHASAHPVAHRADCSSQQSMLTRSSKWGELETLQARVRAASHHLGASDPLIRRTNKVVSKASSLRYYCMNSYVQMSMHCLPRVMDEMIGRLYDLQKLPLGLGVWEDPFLSWAREAEAVWRDDKPRLELLVSLISKPSQYCNMWVQTVLNADSRFLRAFNRAMTTELLKLPDAGSLLAMSIGESLSEVHLPSVREEIRRLASTLGVLESQWLEHALLRQIKGRTSLETAAGLGDIRALCALISALLNEVVIIQPRACAQLAGAVRHTEAMSTMPQTLRAVCELCKRMMISEEEARFLSVELLSNGGLRIGLQTLWGHPSAQSAVDAIGAGAVIEKKMPLGELQRWQSGVDALKEVAAFPDRCERALHASRHCALVLRDARKTALEAVSSAAATSSLLDDLLPRHDAQGRKVAELEEQYMAKVKVEADLSRKALRGSEEDEEVLEKFQQQMREEKQLLNDARQVFGDLQQRMTSTQSHLEEAVLHLVKSAVQWKSASLEAGEKDAVATTTTAAYQDIWHYAKRCGNALKLLDSLGETADLEVAREVLEANAWNLEEALNVLTAECQASSRQDDAEGYRAPMRTGYRDTLLGDPQLPWSFALDSLSASPGVETSGVSNAVDDSEMQRVLAASRDQQQKLDDLQEQDALASAIEASWTQLEEEARKHAQASLRSEEEGLLVKAIEASYREQTRGDSNFREELERALSQSKTSTSDPLPRPKSGPRRSEPLRQPQGSGRSSPVAHGALKGSSLLKRAGGAMASSGAKELTALPPRPDRSRVGKGGSSIRSQRPTGSGAAVLNNLACTSSVGATASVAASPTPVASAPSAASGAAACLAGAVVPGENGQMKDRIGSIQAAKAAESRREAQVFAMSSSGAETERTSAVPAQCGQPNMMQASREVLCSALASLHRRHFEASPTQLRSCLKALKVYEMKFQRINKDNTAFCSRVSSLQGAVEILQACGFRDQGDCWVVDPGYMKQKGSALFDALAKIEVLLHHTRRAETRHGGLLAPSGGACKKLIALSVNPPLTLSCSTRAVEAQAGHDIRDMTEKGEGGSSLGSLEEILDWKEKGNARLKAADNDAALECYSRGINIGVKAISSFQGLAQDFDPLKKAVSQLLSNRGHVRLAQQLPKLALQDCRQAAEVDFENPKAYWRGVTAALQLEEDQERRDAAELLRQGLRLAWGTGGSALSKLLGENLHLWREWADAGHVPSMYLLALAVLKGNQVEQDKAKAFDLFQQAASRGDSASAAMVEHLQAEVCLPPELEVWARAAAAGDAAAQFNLGLAYYRGDRVPQNLAKCAELWAQAAEQGDEMAQDNLDQLQRLMSEQGVQKARIMRGSAGGVQLFLIQFLVDAVLAPRSYIYTLVNVSQWENVLKACEKHAALEDFTLEHAYALYRLNRFQQALQVLDSRKAADKDTAASRLRLQAQIQYRLSDYGACADVYEKLHQEDAEDQGLIVNAVASYVSGDKPRQAMNLIARNKEALESSYELCFNAACALIDEGRLKEAEDKLTQARELCTEELMQAEEIGEEDVALLEDHEELAAIRVQQACVMQRRGQEEEAKEVYDKVLRQKPNQGHEVDVTVLAVACNNVVALRSEGKSLFDSLKRINVASKEGLEHKQTRRQTVEIACNKVLLLLQAQKIDVAKKELDKLCESYPDHPRVALVQAAIAHREKKGKVCEEILQGYIASHADDQEVVLPLAQLYTHQQKHDLAVEVLAKLPLSSRTQPATVEAIVNLHQRQKSPDKAVACLREAIKYWSSQEEESETLAQVVRIAARLAMQLKDRAFAAEASDSFASRLFILRMLVLPLATGPVKPATPEPRMPRSKKLQVESDYTQATASWIARTPSDDTLQERRQQRNRIVVANRITSRETIRAAFKGKSLLEERWIGNLDDSAADTVLNFVQQILAGREVNAVCNVAGRRGRTVSAIQFQAIIHWIAKHKGISYSECITKLVHHPNERTIYLTRLEHYFEEFAHASSYGFMTVYEFTRFCRAFGLFQLRPGRFVEGDVQFLFDLGDEGKAVDLEGFRRVLEKESRACSAWLKLDLSSLQVADRLDLPAQAVYQSYLENIDGSDYEALCGLVQALAVTDPERATEYAERLQVPAFDHLDPEDLEAQPIPKVGAMFSQRRRDREDEVDGKPVRVKKKRKRKIRYPKGFDPENPGPPPDPERWLPKRERSEFKKKMRKRDKHLLRGPQGAITTEDFRKQGPSTAQVEVSKDASGPSRRSGRKAKGK